MTQVNIAGLLALTAGLAAYFDAQGIKVVVGFGWKARTELLNQGPGGANRVIVMAGRVPADVGTPGSIDAGQITQPRFPTPLNNVPRGQPRPLRQMKHLVSVSIWGVAAQGYTGGLGLGDEADQYAATLDLLESTIQGLQNAVWVDPTGKPHPVGLADLRFEQATWVRPPVEMAFGRELLVFLTHNGPLFDVLPGTATPAPAVGRGPLT